MYTMIRAIPHLQQLAPNASQVIGKTTGVSYGAACPEGEWKDIFLSEIEKIQNRKRPLRREANYKQFIALLQLSRVHVYLTYPFVLSGAYLKL